MAKGPLYKLSVKFEFNGEERNRLYVKLGQLMDNGVPLDVALGQVQRIAERKRGSALGPFYKSIRFDVSNGKNFGNVMAKYVPSAEAILLETGSQSGKLSRALRNASDAIENQTKVKKAIVGAATYPMVMIAMLIAALVLSSYKVIPAFTEIIPVDQWQGIAYVTALVCQAVRDYIGVLFMGLGVLMLAIGYSMPRWTGKLRVHFDNYVPWSLYKMWQGSAFLLAISSMMSAGVKLDEVSLAKITRQSDPYLKQRVKGMKRWILSGDNLGDALYRSGYKFPDEDIIGDLQVYARLRGFDQNLIRITKTWVDSLVDKVTITMKIVNFVVLILIAVVIGCLVISFYSVFQQIQSQSGG